MTNPTPFTPPPADLARLAELDSGERAEVRVATAEKMFGYSPFGPPGTRLWVREIFSPCACDECVDAWPEQPLPGRIKQAPHMPSYESTHVGPSGLEFYPAEGLPCWAAQIHLTTIENRVEQADGVWQWVGVVERCERGDDA